MKIHHILLPLLWVAGGNIASAQETTPKKFDLSFTLKDTTLQLVSGVDNTFIFSFKSAVFNEKNKNVVTIVADDMKSDILKKDYKIFFMPKKLGELSDEEPTQFFVTIGKEAQQGKGNKLVLRFSVMDSTGKAIDDKVSKEIAEMTIHIPSDSRLNGYNYLAYVGTNFDLVDGIKAKHLFFATNVFLPPTTTYKIYRPKRGEKGRNGELQKIKKDAVKSVGMYLSLYGNRTFASTDSLRDVYRMTGMSMLNDSIVEQYYERTTLARKRVSDNIGVSFMPLLRLGSASNQHNVIKLYFGPSFDLIWRRIQMEYNYVDRVPTDTIYRPLNETTFNQEFMAPNHLKTNYNEFDVNIGLGTMIVHETNKISIRISMSGGAQLHYIPESLSSTSSDPSETLYRGTLDWYFCGRGWITDQSSGITLQAEVTNALINSRPYYGVTLSKAINYNKLGEIFSPLTSR